MSGVARAVGWRRPLLAALVASTVLFVVVQAGLGTQIDFAVYRMGGHAVVTGHDPYATRLPGLDLPFTYPPAAALFFAPLAVLPVVLGQLVWAVIGCACLVLVVRQCLRELGEPLARWWVPALGAAFWLEPVRHAFELGQIDLVVLALCTTDLLLPRGSRRQGYLLGVAAGFKLTPLIFIPYLALTGQRRAALRATAAFGGMAAIGLLTGPGVAWRFWRDDALDPAHVGGVAYVSNQSLTGVVTRWLRHQPSGAGWSAFLLSVAVAGLALGIAFERRGERLTALGFVAGTGLLVSPISWSHHFVWVVPMLLLVASRGDRVARATVAGLALVFYAAPLWWVPRGGGAEFHHHGWQLAAACSYLAGLLGLLVVMGRTAVRSPSDQPPVTRMGHVSGRFRQPAIRELR